MAVTTVMDLPCGWVNALRDFLEIRLPKFRTLQNLASMMDVTFSGFLRGVKQGTLSVENCLRLAEVLGEDPAAVLRVANKPDVADQITRLYGTPARVFTPDEQELIERWRAMSPRAREGLRVLLRDLTPQLAMKKREKKTA